MRQIIQINQNLVFRKDFWQINLQKEKEFNFNFVTKCPQNQTFLFIAIIKGHTMLEGLDFSHVSVRDCGGVRGQGRLFISGNA